MVNKSEMIEAIMIGNSYNRKALTDLGSKFDFDEMFCDYVALISTRNERIEKAEASGSDVDDSMIVYENIRFVEDAKMIAELGRTLDKMKKLIAQRKLIEEE